MYANEIGKMDKAKQTVAKKLRKPMIFLAILAGLGLVGIKFFEHESHLNTNKINNYDLAAVLCFIVTMLGLFGFAICCLSVLISLILSKVRLFQLHRKSKP